MGVFSGRSSSNTFPGLLLASGDVMASERHVASAVKNIIGM
jgi:hypothetical protein